MDDESGVTRDRQYGYGEWTGKHFTVVDTGGYVEGSDDKFEGEIRKQVRIALDEASVILFMVDCFAGLTGLDQDFANILREVKKPIYIVANKADNNERSFMATEFYSLGFEHMFPISAVNGGGTGDLLDAVVGHFEMEGDESPMEGVPKIAIVGRPNVGKSSFINALLGESRSIVTDEAGTTRDSINTHYKLYGKDFLLTDTAGIRKKAKVKEDIEFYSVMRAIQSIQDCDVCMMIIDAERGLEAQDMNIIGLANKYNKGIMIMVNKWDLIKKDTMTADVYRKQIYEKISPNDFIPIIFTSVTNKQRIFQAIELAMEINDNRQLKISTSKLNETLLPIIERQPPPSLKGKYIKIKYITQLPTKTPTFAFFCNLPQYIKVPYERFLENKLRKSFSLTGVPVKIFFRKK